MTENKTLLSADEVNHETISQQQILDEIGYYKATAITELLYMTGIITFDEYDKLTQINRQTFSPMYADLLPKPLDKAPKQS